NLGNDADEPGSIWSTDNHVEILQPSPRQNDGVDVAVTAPLGALVRVELRDAQDANSLPVVSETPLADLASKPPQSKELNKSGNRLLIRRAPGDMLRVTLPRDHLVFSPGETIRLDIEPRLLPVTSGTSLQLRARLLAAGGVSEISNQEQGIKTTAEDS